MSKAIIKVENLSKRYKLGVIGTGTLSHDLNHWWNKKWGKNNTIADNDIPGAQDEKNADFIWSLRNINFEVEEGDIFGVIGKNGAGKSTLLKLLSKITKPTSGTIHLNGRIASLLEVGTGFHPDLTGRENIFLNGAILGMKREEIARKFDEIVEFSGVENFIDTPVKRYSSGMYVRLAFAVAAHLEPEILIIDEVLAVGDAEFQKKCMGKIKDVSFNQGRTILFVSHNITAIKQLCKKVLFLEKGKQNFVGPVDSAIRLYQENTTDKEVGVRQTVTDFSKGFFKEWRLLNPNRSLSHACFSRENITFQFTFQTKEKLHHCEFRLTIAQNVIAVINASSLDNNGDLFSLEPGIFHFTLTLNLPIHEGKYDIEAGLISTGILIDLWRSSTPLQILNNYENYTSGGILNLFTTFQITKDSKVIISASDLTAIQNI